MTHPWGGGTKRGNLVIELFHLPSMPVNKIQFLGRDLRKSFLNEIARLQKAKKFVFRDLKNVFMFWPPRKSPFFSFGHQDFMKMPAAALPHVLGPDSSVRGSLRPPTSQHRGSAKILPFEVVFVLPQPSQAGPARVKKNAGLAPDRDLSEKNAGRPESEEMPGHFFHFWSCWLAKWKNEKLSMIFFHSHARVL